MISLDGQSLGIYLVVIDKLSVDSKSKETLDIDGIISGCELKEKISGAVATQQLGVPQRMMDQYHILTVDSTGNSHFYPGGAPERLKRAIDDYKNKNPTAILLIIDSLAKPSIEKRFTKEAGYKIEDYTTRYLQFLQRGRG